MEGKLCIGCKLTKPLAEYYDSSRHEDGKNPYCKQCCKVNRSLEAVRKRDKRSKMSVRQRIRATHAKVEVDKTVTLAKIFKNSRGICGVCKKWVQPRHASMDHIVPIIRGGSHTYDNLQITHLKCNLRKGAS